MLEPDGRALLLDAFRPPEGYRLDYGVATTFTLHLDTALSVPLSFLSRRLADSGDPIALMEAVRAAADRLDIFHQAGMIAMPPSRSPIFSFLEPVLHAVRRPKAGHLFHPKLWALRYVADDDVADVRMRLLVPSRNLTADRSWDLCLQLEGQLGPDPVEGNSPVAELLTVLPGMCLSTMPPDRIARLDALVSDLQRTEWELPEHVDELFFDVLGLGRPLADDFFVGHEHLVISPFCTDGGLATVTGRTPATVVSRQETLDGLDRSALGEHETFVLDPLTSEMEDKGDGTHPSAIGLTGLHAKCFILRYGRKAWIRVGSANATEAAFAGNVEILVSLVGSAAKLGVTDLFKAESSLRSILTEYSPQAAPDEDDVAGQLGDLLIDLASGDFTASVQSKDQGHLIQLQGPAIPTLPVGARVTVHPVTVPEFAAEVPPEQLIDVTFGPLEVDQISAFVIITVMTQEDVSASAVVLADLVGAPINRLDEIIARQVDTPEKFLRFLALLLGVGQPAWTVGMEPVGSAGASAAPAFEAPGLLELLMWALVEHPGRLDDLARLVDRLGASADRGSVLPDGFSEIWAVVDAVRRDQEAVA
ncbi:phospholipase D family protein [Modestobacter sp. VKM Ac-2979]|uniref:phospholipase D family protein n=1 Tax=unclassified Modestobacter TaxID=2643866 RepID=UPI0022ABB9F2|nr:MULTISPECIES: phospholipase D family protein [unclassified Modestobacter]MCZ2813833.1 phospholipase D family protein [Modestobacter sp. VKM Ac-2979]MCZ2844192.1 phospholipase D family protein [Modestobacter sp. VKM Ac-2980]